MNRNKEFPLPPPTLNAFQVLKEQVKNATLLTIDPESQFEVETDASDYCIAASLNQNGRPVAFFSRTLTPHEGKHHAVEKEAAAIVESLLTWRQFLLGKKFLIITDQKSISYIYDNKRKSKIKNDKIARWRVELSQFKFNIVYRPGKDNVVADTFTRIPVNKSAGIAAVFCQSLSELHDLHEKLCHPGVTRFFHFVHQKNLPYSVEQVRHITSCCKSCAYLKPKFAKSRGTLIKAILPFQRLSIDFKGPLPMSSSGNRYLFTIIDEFSRFSFAYPCKDMSSKTVIQCFNNLFSVFGMPDMVHSDRAKDFLSAETQLYLRNKNISTSKTSRYNPRGNGQVEKLNGTLWKAIQVTLHSRKLSDQEWETILPDALHSLRYLLCTATNTTPHERLFKFSRKSTTGKSIPSWIKPGPVFIKNHTRKKQV